MRGRGADRSARVRHLPGDHEFPFGTHRDRRTGTEPADHDGSIMADPIPTGGSFLVGILRERTNVRCLAFRRFLKPPAH